MASTFAVLDKTAVRATYRQLLRATFIAFKGASNAAVHMKDHC